MRKILLGFIGVFLLSTLSFANADGIITIKSAHSVKATADRLISKLKAKGMTVFIRIDHAAGAKKVGKKLLPTELVIFGNPKVGTPLMQCNINAGIDLPQKALIHEDSAGAVWFSYNDPKYMAKKT